MALLLTPRGLVFAGLLLSYIWRFHDLAPILAPLRLAAIFTVCSWGFLLISPQASVLKRVIAYPYVVFFLLWSVWIAIGMPFALSPDVAWERVWAVHFKNVTMFLFILGFITSLRAAKVFVLVQLFGAGVLTFFYAKGGFPTLWTPVGMYDRNDLALHFVMMAPLALFMALTSAHRWARIAAWGLTAALGTSVILSQSRGGFLGLVAVTLFLVFRLAGVKNWMRILPPVLLVSGLLLAPPQVRERLRSLGSLEDDYNMNSDVGRKEVWKRGLTYMAGHPLFGIGANNFWVAEGTLTPRGRSGDPTWKASVAHSSFISVGAETGLVGLLLYLGMLASALWGTVKVRSRWIRSNAPSAGTVVKLIDCTSASIIGFMVTGAFLSQEYSAIVFSVIALVAGIEFLSSSTFSRSRPTPPYYRNGHERSRLSSA